MADNDPGEETEYRIEYTIQRQLPGEEDFTDIGFGSSASARDLEDAMYAIESDVTRGQWETEGDMPDSASVMDAIARTKDQRS